MLASCVLIPGEEGVGVGVCVGVGIGVGTEPDAVRLTSTLPPIVQVLVCIAVLPPTLKVTACPS